MLELRRSRIMIIAVKLGRNLSGVPRNVPRKCRNPSYQPLSANHRNSESAGVWLGPGIIRPQMLLQKICRNLAGTISVYLFRKMINIAGTHCLWHKIVIDRIIFVIWKMVLKILHNVCNMQAGCIFLYFRNQYDWNFLRGSRDVARTATIRRATPRRCGGHRCMKK